MGKQDKIVSMEGLINSHCKETPLYIFKAVVVAVVAAAEARAEGNDDALCAFELIQSCLTMHARENNWNLEAMEKEVNDGLQELRMLFEAMD